MIAPAALKVEAQHMGVDGRSTIPSWNKSCVNNLKSGASNKLGENHNLYPSQGVAANTKYNPARVTSGQV